MSPIQYHPPALSVVVVRGKEKELRCEASLYCFDCKGDPNSNSSFGAFLRLASLQEILNLAQEHDSTHNLTIVDETSCGMGLW